MGEYTLTDKEKYQEMCDFFLTEGVRKALKCAFLFLGRDTSEYKDAQKAYHVCEAAFRLGENIVKQPQLRQETEYEGPSK